MVRPTVCRMAIKEIAARQVGQLTAVISHCSWHWLLSPAMLRLFSLVLLLALVVAACGATTETTTTTIAESMTTESTTTTAPAPTATPQDELTTTTNATTTTSSGPVVALIEIVVAGGAVERVERFDVPIDGAVRLTVTADRSDEVHLHGYDLHADVTADAGAILEFSATIPGIFEIELEGSGVLIGELQVAP